MLFIILQIAFVFWNFCPFHPFCPEAVLVILGPSYVVFIVYVYMYLVKPVINKYIRNKQFLKGNFF